MNGCPTPWKIRYDSRSDAKSAVQSWSTRKLKGQLHAYSCPCGCWHLSSIKKRALKRHQRRRAA